MKNGDKVKAIVEWQHSDMHHLTCGNCKKDLYPMINDNLEIILACDCDYTQEYIPEVIYKRYKMMREN